MNRRLFLNQSANALALQFLPVSLFASSFSDKPAAPATSLNRMMQEIGSALQNGQIGKLEKLTITHIYSPEQTSKAALQILVERDFAWIEQLIGTVLSADPKLIFADSPSTAFGSYSARFTSNDLVVVWRGLARVSRQIDPGAPISLLQLAGTKGTFRLGVDKRNYRFVDLDGRTIKAGNHTSDSVG